MITMILADNFDGLPSDIIIDLVVTIVHLVLGFGTEVHIYGIDLTIETRF